MAFSLIAGDLLPVMQIQLAAPAAIASVATAVSVQMLWQKPDGSPAILVPLSIVNPGAGIVQYTWQMGDTLEVGIHLYQVVLNMSGNQTITDPNDGTYAKFRIYPRL
jgi:hypothetical protein